MEIGGYRPMSRNKNRNRYSGYNKEFESQNNNTNQKKEETKEEEQKDAMSFVPSETDILEEKKEAAAAVEPVDLDPVEEALEEAIEKVADISSEVEEKEPRIPTEIKEDRPVLPNGQFKVTSVKLRVRKEPSKDADVVKLLNMDDILEGASYDDDWIKLSNGEGYVMKEFTTRYA